jgi:ATP-dependent Clp protease adaptor protein ClpS
MSDINVLEPELKNKKKVKEPTFWKVILKNDDFTPMNFVIDVLQKFFGKSAGVAEQIMMNVHEQGQGIAGLYTHEIAETKVEQVNTYAKQHNHPFTVTMQEN